jgi:uncharacterized membrane protein (DUF4010 family)
LAFRHGDQQQALKFRNPFGLWSVIGLSVFLAAIILAGRVVGESFGAAGAIIGAIVAGLSDVDAVTVSIAHMTPATLAVQHAAYAVLAAVASNTLGKIGIGAVIDRGWFAAEIGMMVAFCFAAAGLALGLTLVLPA